MSRRSDKCERIITASIDSPLTCGAGVQVIVPGVVKIVSRVEKPALEMEIQCHKLELSMLKDLPAFLLFV